MNGDDRAAVPKAVWLGLLVVAGLCLIAEFFIHHHGYFGVDEGFAFYGWYTLVCAVAGVLVARVVGAVLGRAEHYYD